MENFTEKSVTAIHFSSHSSRTHRDEVTHNKIHRHLTDINDTITEDDIRNIDIFSFHSTIMHDSHPKKPVQRVKKGH